MPFFILLLLSLFVAAGCGPHYSPRDSKSSNGSVGDDNGSTGGDDSGTGGATDLGICGPLNFNDVKWPKDLSLDGRRAFATALNITGSFEGNDLWKTIADNSDGQGVSLGLLQQNLGQGTLQPLLIRIRRDNPELLTQLFSSADRTSLLQMLSAWEGTIGPARAILSDDVLLSESSGELFPDREVLSPLDQSRVDGNVGSDSNLNAEADITFAPRVTARNAASVAWAKRNLYSNNKFISRWKKSLTDLAATAPYRTLQIAEARELFDKAEGYFAAFKFREQRSFFLMFDFVVQNGGFSSTHKKSYDKYLKATPAATETAKAKKLLEIRLVSVIARYRNDVRSRKNTIIDSVGTVHGRRRNLPRENCYIPKELLTQ